MLFRSSYFIVDCNDTKKIEVFDALGRVVASYKTIGDVNKIDVSKLSRGTYVVKIETLKNEILTEKLVIH